MVVAVILGLAIAGGIYWYQNPDFEVNLPRGFINQVARQFSGEQTPESFVTIVATSTPNMASRDTATQASGSDGGDRLRQSIPQLSNESGEEREARVRMESEAKVSELELEVHAGINTERAKQGRSPLAWDKGLASVARAHSDDMAERQYFDHDTPEGLDPTDRLHRAGLNCRKGYYYGIAENIFAIETTETILGNLRRTAAEAVRGWMNSPGHRSNILDGQYDRTGIGASFGTWRGYNKVYLTQVFC